jgi:hypothetical protein
MASPLTPENQFGLFGDFDFEINELGAGKQGR